MVRHSYDSAKRRDPPGSQVGKLDHCHLNAISVWDGNILLFSLPEQTIRSGVISVKR
jgi:hypothetical protein